MSLYRGGFLSEDEGEPWPVTMRERLRGRFIHAVAEPGGAWSSQEADSDRVLSARSGCRSGHRAVLSGLMRCYAASNAAAKR